MNAPRITAPKHGGKYRYRRGYAEGIFYIDGRRRIRRLVKIETVAKHPSGRKRTDDQIVAALLERWDVERMALETERDKKGLPILEVMDAWIGSAKSSGLAPSTVDLHYRVMRKNYEQAVGNHPIRQIELENIDAFKAALHGRGLAPATINLRLAKLRVFLNWAQRRDYLPALPLIERVKEPRKLPKVPDVAQIKALFQHLAEKIKNEKSDARRYQYELHEMLFLLVLTTGKRRGAIVDLKWDQLDLHRGLARVMDEKTGEELVVLPKTAWDYLNARRHRFPAHTWLFDSGKDPPGQAFNDAHSATTAARRHLAAVGITGIKPLHGFRANLATVSLDQLGLSTGDVRASLNHASITTTESAYLASVTGAKRRAAAAFEKDYLKPLFDTKP